MKFRAFLGDFTGVLQWIYRGFQSFFGGSSVVLRFSSGVLLLSCVFFRRFTLVLRMFYVCFLFSSGVHLLKFYHKITLHSIGIFMSYSLFSWSSF